MTTAQQTFADWFVSHTAAAPTDTRTPHGPAQQDGSHWTRSQCRAGTFRPQPTPAQVAATWTGPDQWTNC